MAWADTDPRELINAGGERAVLDPRQMICRAIVDDGDAQREATIAGCGLSVNSLWNVVHEIRAGRLIRVLPDWRLNDQAVLWLVYPRSNILTPKTRLFIDFLIAQPGNRAEWR
ncbi:MAG: LysR substrate-binding domain-containing protein [Paracoccus sp. (in: a-proteobacteria)]